MKRFEKIAPEQHRKIVKAAQMIALAGVAIALAGAFILINRGSGGRKSAPSALSDDSSAARGGNESGTSAPPPEDISGYASHTFAENSPAAAESASESGAGPKSDSVKHGWVINDYGYTYVYGNSGYEQFNYKPTALIRYVNSLNALAGLVPESARMFNIIAPVSCTFADIPREIYTADGFYNAAQGDFVKAAGAKLDDRITNIDVIPSVKSLYDAGDAVFYRTDRNWTSEAAYAAYADYCAAAGLHRYSANSFPKNEAGEFLGSFYKATENEDMKNSPDSLVCYCPIPALSAKLTVYSGDAVYDCFSPGRNAFPKTDGETVYFGMKAGRYSISTSAGNGKKLLIIGDSSSYPLAMLLSAHYSLVEVIEPKYFKRPFEEYLTNSGFDDILTVCYSTSAVNGDYVPVFNIMTGVTKNEKNTD